jgi:uncharacterized protein YraI
MTGDGAIPGTPESMNFADCTARNAGSGHKAASITTAMLRAGISPKRRADKAPTPFFDLLTTMIEAQAAENARLLQRVGATGGIASNHRWHARHLKVCVVGLIVVLGSAFYVSEAGEQQPPVIAAHEEFQARSALIGNANANDEQIERPPGVGEPSGPRTIGVEQEQMDEGGTSTKSASKAGSDDETVVTYVVGQPGEKLGFDTENLADDVAREQMPSEAMRAHSIAPAVNESTEEPSRDAVSPSSVLPQTRSVAKRTNDPVAIQVGRVTSGVNMRAGPSNGQPVLATIPQGSPVEVIKCRHWCEVIFAGQRGWVYKIFIRAPLADTAISPQRTSPRKAGSNSGVSVGTRTWASAPRKRKPAAVRLSADRSTRDAPNLTQSNSSPFFWNPIEYLWKQMLPTTNSD